jgi:photosystem II stability/assembly factor-like uncharacterized protein
VILVGTANGVFLARSNGNGYQARPVGLQGRGQVRALLADARQPGRIYAGTSKGGVFRSDDGGQSWQEMNEGLVYKEAWSLAQNPTSGDLYAGTQPFSVFKSADGGASWTECEKLKTLPDTIGWTFPNPPHVAHVKGLDVTASGRVMGAIEEGWLVRSEDGGETWENIKNGTCLDSHYVVSMPDDPDVVFSTSGMGVFKSTDGGRSFAKAMRGLDRTYMTQVVVHPERPRVLFTAAAEVPPPWWFLRPVGANSAVYRSEDQGDSWQRLTGGLPEQLNVAIRAAAGDPRDPETFLVGTFPEGSVWLTEDSGESFRQVVTGIPPVFGLLVLRG